MKHRLVIVLLILASCSGKQYLPAFTALTNSIQASNAPIIFESADFTIIYNLNSSLSRTGFVIRNKTNVPLVVDIQNSYFVIDGKAFKLNTANSISTNPADGFNFTNAGSKITVLPNSSQRVSNFSVSPSPVTIGQQAESLKPDGVRILPPGQQSYDAYIVLAYQKGLNAPAKLYVNRITNRPDARESMLHPEQNCTQSIRYISNLIWVLNHPQKYCKCLIAYR